MSKYTYIMSTYIMSTLLFIFIPTQVAIIQDLNFIIEEMVNATM